VKRLGMLGVSVRKIKALTMIMETVTLIDKGRYNVTCIKCVKLIVKYFFIGRFIFEGGCLRLMPSYIQVNMVI
jgi:hypothetical protein